MIKQQEKKIGQPAAAGRPFVKIKRPKDFLSDNIIYFCQHFVHRKI